MLKRFTGNSTTLCVFLPVLVVSILVTFPAPTGCFAQDSTNVLETGASNETDIAYEKMKQLAEVMLHVREHYVEPVSYDRIMEGALDGMLRSVDQYSGFLEQKAYKEMKMETTGEYSGIGIHVGVRNGLLTVIAPIEDTPGFRAGLQSGDRIIEIDGKDTVDLSIEEAVKTMRGKKGEPVTLTIKSPEEEGTKEVRIVRDRIEVPSIKGERILESSIGYVRITTFSETTPSHLETALEKLKTQGMNALVLDLRSNPGGLLSSAHKVADKFLARGRLIVTTKGRPGVHDPTELSASDDPILEDMPIAVLVNGGTASASEIVAGALQAHSKAVLVGDTTFGKGSVQSVVPLRSEPDTAIRLTTAYYYTPDGEKIHQKGLSPDIRVTVSQKKWREIQLRRAKMENPEAATKDGGQERLDDPQLERAVDVLKAVVAFGSGSR